ncbi:MAG: PAS domain S-box protein [Methylococcales bacterium]|nr:PAS domain S-box protein [Methylococcales bacterium]
MTKKTDDNYQQLEQHLRDTAETQLKYTEQTVVPFTSPSEILHELQVHQIELQMQNEELLRTQLALEESRDRYVDLYEFAPVGYLTLTVDGTIDEINLTGATLLGVERMKLIHRRFAHYIVPEDRDRWYRHVMAVKQHRGHKQTIELALRRADDTRLYAHINCMLINSTDELNTLRITVTDITERKKMEDALSKSEAQLAGIIEGAELATWDWNIQTGDLLCNDFWAEMRGYLPEEIETNIAFWEQGIFPEDLNCVQNLLKAHLSGYAPFFSAEYRVHTKSGAWIWILARGKVVERDSVNNPLRITGITMNITKRKQMEQRLRIAAAAFETQAGIIVTDADKYILCVNQAFTEITGYAEKDAIGRSAAFLQSGLLDERFYQTMWSDVNKNGYWQGEMWDKRKNGELFPVWLTITAVFDSQRQISHYVGSFMDLTVQKQAENVLLEARQQLESKVAKTQEELEKIRQDSLHINTALNVLLRHRESDKCDAQNALSREVEGTVLPFLNRLKSGSSDKNQARLIGILEKNLHQLVKFYGRETSLSSVYQKLTPAEIQVASMVRQGLSTKLIAITLHLSTGTIGIHRKHIRRKLELDSKEINLYSYLTSLIE